MKLTALLLAALLFLSAGMLAAGCTTPGGNVTQPTTLPTETGTPSATATATTPAGTGTPSATATTATTAVTTTATTAAGGQTTTIDISAADMAFDTSTITVPAGAEVTVVFDNRDDGIPHNVAFYTDSSATEEIFVGDTVAGPGTVTYIFTAPEEPGTYFFRCDVHPQEMTGDFIVE